MKNYTKIEGENVEKIVADIFLRLKETYQQFKKSIWAIRSITSNVM